MQSETSHIIDFKDSEIAFRKKSNAELRQTHFLFRMMNNQFFVKLGKQLIDFSFALHLPIQGAIRATIYRHFVGGVSIEDCSKTIEKLRARNTGSILDYAVEGEENEQLFDSTCQEVIRTIEYAEKHDDIPFSVFKITGVGRFDLLAKVSESGKLSEEETQEFQRVSNRVEAIFRRGFELGVPILIDAEETWIQPVIDDMVLELMAKYNKEKAIVQNTYQMYRHDSIARIKEHHKMALDGGFKLGLKIVRGAYMEKERARAIEKGYPSPIQPDKQATDNDFNEIMRYFMQNIDTIDFMSATHNEKSVQLLVDLIEEYQLPKNHPAISFSQLYGMSDHITYNLAERGYNVVKYVPYGKVKTMMPYLLRRAQENSSVKGQSSRELKLIEKEMKRRKIKK